MEIWKKIAELESSTAKIRDDIARLSTKEPSLAESELVAAALIRDLAQRADLLEIRTALDSIT